MKDASLSSTSTAESPSDPAASSASGAPAPTPAADPVPDSYQFKGPDGVEFDKSLLDRATPIFRELGLGQSSAQKLVDIYTAIARDSQAATMKAVDDLRLSWREAVAKDPVMGGKLEAIRADIGRMKDTIFGTDKTARSAFEDAMNLTGAGDHPAIISAFWKASEAFREGSHVSGSGPSAHGQRAPNIATEPSAAQAMYPNLPSRAA